MLFRLAQFGLPFGVTIHGLGAAHSNDLGRYSKFCFAKIAPHF